MARLVIAEKPSVAKSIAEVLGADKNRDGYILGEDYIISWCVGHLVGLVEASEYNEKYKKWSYDDLPIIPSNWQHKILPTTKKQYHVLEKLLRSDEVDEVICATDAGREGELIFRLVYNQAGCDKPVKRLWISSMEESAIRDGFDYLRSGDEFDNLYQSALCRSKADWLVGINGTRLFTTIYNHKLLIGRVQTPTLSMVVERERNISEFKKESYYLVHLLTNNLDAVSNKFATKEEAETLSGACQEGQALVVSVVNEKKSQAPPKLYDLTTLQREANRIFGYTAQQTLDLAQTLYEKKLLTYPRTDSRYLTKDMEGSVIELINDMRQYFPFANDYKGNMNVSNVVNNSKVSDHHAIIPTRELNPDSMDKLSATEKNIALLVAFKLLCGVSDKMAYETTKVTLRCSGHDFEAKGKVITSEGYYLIEKAFMGFIGKSDNKKPKEKKEVILPKLSEGEVLSNATAKVSNHMTSPPKHYTEDSLLSSMELAGAKDMSDEAPRKGIGTPATRAAIIEKLISAGLIKRSNKQLLSTKDGEKLISVLPEEIKSAKLTADWEMQLTDVSKGNLGSDEFLKGIEDMVQKLVANYEPVCDKDNPFDTTKNKLGKCPRCGRSVIEINKGFVCEGGKECGFALWKANPFLKSAKKKLTPELVSKLLSGNPVKVSGLYSPKKDKKYTANLTLDDTGDYVNIKISF